MVGRPLGRQHESPANAANVRMCWALWVVRTTTEKVIEVFDAFSQNYYEQEFLRHGKLCFVVIDNASMHTSAAFRERMEDWSLRGVIPRYLPTYSPELNLIEILWRKIKYEWLPLQAFRDSIHFKYWLNKILEAIGTEYQVSFS